MFTDTHLYMVKVILPLIQILNIQVQVNQVILYFYILNFLLFFMCIEPDPVSKVPREWVPLYFMILGAPYPSLALKCCSWVSWGRHLHTEHHIGVLRAIASRQKSRGLSILLQYKDMEADKETQKKTQVTWRQLPFGCLEGFNSFRKSLRNCHSHPRGQAPASKVTFPPPSGAWPFPDPTKRAG